MFGKMKIFLMITAFFAVSFVYAEDPVIDEGPLSVNSFCLLEEGGSVYINPDVPAGKPSYKYAVVEVDTVLPGIDYDIMEEVILEPADGEPLSGFFLNYYHLLEEESFLLKGMSSELQPAWFPSGTITVVDDELGTVPVANVEVQIISSLLNSSTFLQTDGNGNFVSDKSFRSDVWYRIHWRDKNNKFWMYIVQDSDPSSNKIPLSYLSPEASGAPWIINITESSLNHQWFYAHVFRGANHFFNNPVLSSDISNVGIKAYLLLEDFGRAFTSRNEISMPGKSSTGGRRGSANLFMLTIHELAHLDHFDVAVGTMCNFTNRPIVWDDERGNRISKKITEGYAMLVERYLAALVYIPTPHLLLQYRTLEYFWTMTDLGATPPVYGGNQMYSSIGIDLIDSYNQREKNDSHPGGETYPVDNVSGYYISDVRESLKNSANFMFGWTQSLRDKFPDNPTNDERLDRLFIQYVFRPLMIDWMDPVDFPPWVPEGVIVPPPPQQM